MLDYLGYTEDNILECVDEYTLYCYYLGFDPTLNEAYTSPIREEGNYDDRPSFTIFRTTQYTDVEFLWKDLAMNHKVGTIFTLVELMYGLSKREARHKICGDFGLGGATRVGRELIGAKKIPLEYSKHIRIKSKAFNDRELRFYAQFGIDKNVLDRYHVTSISCYWSFEEQTSPYFPLGGMGFANRVLDKFQLYFPYADHSKRFKSSWNTKCIPGFAQRQGKDTLIITKSYKDLMCLSNLGLDYDVVANRGENIVLPDEFITWAKANYKTVFTLFDNDGKHSADKYPFKAFEFPLELKEKDATDFYKRYGRDKLIEQVKKFIWLSKEDI